MTVSMLAKQEQALDKKKFWRIVPILFVVYMFCSIDRYNVSFATLTMSKDLHFTAAIFGFGAGIFYIGYLLFQIPFSVSSEKKSARKLIAFMSVGWGAVAM